MNEQEALNEFKAICDDNKDDREIMHIEADQLLCRLLEDKYPLLMKEYKLIPKWYA